jgi:hypothetical protein
MSFLGDALAVNTTLIELDLSFNDTITSTGWREFFEWTRNKNSSLKILNLSECNIDDVGADLIALALVQSNSINEFDIECNSISSSGWLNFIEILLNGNRSLEKLNIEPGKFRDKCWNAMSSALCDKSSIESIYSSNHAFHNLPVGNYPWVPDDVKSLLQINKNDDKSEVARQKILKHHFSGGSTNNSHMFSEMPESMMPHVLGWIGRNRLGYSLMHCVIRDFPTLLGSCNEPLSEGGKKQKC